MAVQKNRTRRSKSRHKIIIKDKIIRVCVDMGYEYDMSQIMQNGEKFFFMSKTSGAKSLSRDHFGGKKHHPREKLTFIS